MPDISYELIDDINQTNRDDPVRLIWGHGWGQDRTALLPLAQSLSGLCRSFVLDFPGFGQSPKPDSVWGTAEYADAVAELIKKDAEGSKIIWIGHSFGGRVGLQLAARHPELMDGLFLIASHGIPRKRSLYIKVKHFALVYTYKILRRLTEAMGGDVDKLRSKFGSPDYKNAGAMRDIFVKTVNEDLSAVAAQISCPVQLVYGAQDTETPPEIGERLSRLIPDAQLTVMDGYDHYSILGAGRHQVIKRLRAFVEKC